MTIPIPDHRPRTRRDPTRRIRAMDAPRPRGHLREAARRSADRRSMPSRCRLPTSLPAGPGLLGGHPLRRRHAGEPRPRAVQLRPSINIGDLPPELEELLGSMINMDAPKHTKLRLIVNRGSRRDRSRISKTTCAARHARSSTARAIVGECDFVSEIAAALPLQIICDMMGIPAATTQRIFELTNTILGVGDPEYVARRSKCSWPRAWSFPVRRRSSARTGSTTHATTSPPRSMHAEVDGETAHQLRPASSARSSSSSSRPATRPPATRSATGCSRSPRNPISAPIWTADPEGVSTTAVEEIVRWATPVIHFRRTATARRRRRRPGDQGRPEGRDVVQLGQPRRARVRRPVQVRRARTPNEHVGFGAGGPHFCLGANLARREIKLMFEELFRRLPDIEITGEPDMLQCAFIHGIKRMPCAWHTVRA